MIDIYYKSGVSLKGVQPQVMHGLLMCARGYEKFGAPNMWVTSICDGKHKAGSKHYEGLAFDLRTNMYDEEQKQKLAGVLRGILEGEWDVVVEATHIHVEFDPD